RPLRRWVTGWEFRRGLVEAVVCEAGAVLQGGGGLFAPAPVRHVKFVGAAGHLDELTPCPLLGPVEALQFSSNYLGDAGVRALLRSEHLGGLRSLNLGQNALTSAGAADLAACGLLAKLEELYLGHNAIDGGGLGELSRSPHLGSLVALHLE